jgi:hypothetical protein
MSRFVKYWPPLLIWLGVIFVGSTDLMSADTEPSQTSGAPVITAKPEHVTVTGASGSTEIHWDTGN